MSYKTIDGLMRHLRESGIEISGSKEKRQLMNTGYYHGYKGYRFFGNSGCRIPFTSYKEIDATVTYDSRLKSLFYDKVMYIETAVKNIALQCIIEKSKSESIQAMYDHAVESYNTTPGLSEKRRKEIQTDKLSLQNTIQTYLFTAYKSNNPKITHFYNNMSYSGVPVWALFEVITLGDLGKLLSCLTYDVRDSITRELGFNTAADTDRELVYKYIYSLKDFRNAIAHNAVVFDSRFVKFKPSPAMESCIINDVKVPYIHFDKIDDYVILVCYYLKQLKVSKTEIKAFIRSYENIVDEYKKSVDSAVSSIVIHPDQRLKMNALKNFI